MSDLPKLYRPVRLCFWSLRECFGPNLGVTEIDEKVIRKCMRVRTDDGWAWQICNASKLREWDWFVDTDQECVNEDKLGFEWWDGKTRGVY